MKRRQQRGYVLMTVVVTLFLLGTIVMLLVYDSANSARGASSELEAARAEFVARAGMQNALWRAQNNACLGDVSVPVTTLGSDTFDATVSGAAAGSLVVVSADRDAWIRSDDTDKNNGKTASNHVRYESGKIEQVLTRFDVSSISSKAQINSAVAWFHVKALKEHPEGHITIHEITADWNETAVTWDSFAGAYRVAEIGTIPAQDTGDVWVAINVTGLVQSWVNGQPNHGILFNSSAEGLHTEYTAREDGANPPRLEIVLGSGAASPVTLQATGALNSGIKRNLQRTNVPALQPPTTVVLQPGPSDGIDTYTWETNKSTNYETDDEIWASRSTNNTSLALLKFAVDSIPSSARVIRATLSLHHRTGNNSGVPIGAYRVARSWAEDGATWNNRMAGQSWTTPGGDIGAIAVDTVTVGAPYSVRREWEIGPLVQDWVDGTYENYGVALATFLNGSTGHRFDSSDHADPSRRPSLTITFACECGTPCYLPRGDGRIALIGDDWTPDPDDQFKIALFESWGYDVDFYQDRDSDGIDWSDYDVAYVSETAIASDVNADLRNLSIGIINEEPNLYDDIRVASGDTENVGSTIDIIDNDHFITSVFPVGPLSIYSGNMEILTANAPLAGGLQGLGEFGGQTTLATLDAGAAATSGTAAGRRAILPFGQHFAAGFDWRHLNSNGHLLVHRAIEWAMGADKGAPAGKLLFVVGNAGNPNNHDQARQSLFESMGYVVTLIDDGAAPDKYKMEIIANDVVYVSSSINSSTLGSKLNGMPLGIVNEDPDMIDEFGFGATGSTATYNAFTAMDPNHYIGEPFGGAAVTLWPSNIAMPLVRNDLAPDLWNAASIGTLTWAVPTLGVGAERWDGALSLGRRAHLPYGNADSSILTEDARTILQRSLAWAAGAGPRYRPIAHWKLDETSGSTAVDSDGGHDGTLAMPENWVAGPIDGGLEFDGVDDAIVVPHDETLSLTQAISFSAWVRSDAFGQSGAYDLVVSKGTVATSYAYYFGALYDEIMFGFSADGQYREFTTPNLNLATGIWHHLAATFDSASNEVRLYHNGVEVLSTTTTYEPSATTHDIYIGSSEDGADWDGVLDDVRIYERRLSASEVEKLAEPPQVVPIAHWPLDENAGPSAVDSLGGRIGTLTNGPAWAAGAIASGVRFDGSNDRINVPHDNGLNLMSEMTLSAWIYADTLKPFQMILTKGDNGVAENYWLATEGNKLNFGFIDGGLYAQYTSSSLTLEAGRWHHVAATFDNAADTVSLYIDGSAQNFYSANNPAANNERLIIGSSYYGGEGFDGVIDDVRIYNYALGAQDISDLGATGGGGGGGGSSYVEKNHVFTVSANNSWRTVDLSGQGVPPNAVVEIAMENTSSNREREAGIRSVGASAPTYDLHEAEGGGVDALTKHVQADASGQIQAYAENREDVDFRLLGYWTGGSYTNTDGLFTSSTRNSWRLHNMTSFGIQPRQVVEFIVQNTSGGTEYFGGVRKVGSSDGQMRELHEAENGGKDFHSVFVETDDNVSAAIEAYAESTGSIEFKPAGMWTTPPGTYTQHDAVIDIGGPTSNNTWQTVDLSSFGVPPNAVLQITLSNKNNSGERTMGVRSVGSSLDRYIELHEAEGNGEDLVTMHVKADANSRIQWYHSRPSDPHRYHLMGWWVLD